MKPSKCTYHQMIQELWHIWQQLQLRRLWNAHSHISQSSTISVSFYITVLKTHHMHRLLLGGEANIHTTIIVH